MLQGGQNPWPISGACVPKHADAKGAEASRLNTAASARGPRAWQCGWQSNQEGGGIGQREGPGPGVNRCNQHTRAAPQRTGRLTCDQRRAGLQVALPQPWKQRGPGRTPGARSWQQSPESGPRNPASAGPRPPCPPRQLRLVRAPAGARRDGPAGGPACRQSRAPGCGSCAAAGPDSCCAGGRGCGCACDCRGCHAVDAPCSSCGCVAAPCSYCGCVAAPCPCCGCVAAPCSCCGCVAALPVGRCHGGQLPAAPSAAAAPDALPSHRTASLAAAQPQPLGPGPAAAPPSAAAPPAAVAAAA